MMHFIYDAVVSRCFRAIWAHSIEIKMTETGLLGWVLVMCLHNAIKMETTTKERQRRTRRQHFENVCMTMTTLQVRNHFHTCV